MDEVFMNLLSNAIKYTPSGGRIGVYGGAAGDHIAIDVRDNGHGIDTG